MREETERIDIQGSNVPKGKTHYKMTVLDANNSLLPITDENENENRGRKAYNLRVEHGINRFLSGYAAFVDIPTDFEDRQYLITGVNFNAFSGAGRLEINKELGGGAVLDSRFATTLLGVNINFQNSLFRDFESRDAGFGDNKLEHETRLALSKNTVTPFGRLGLSAGASHQERESNSRNTNLNFGQSLSNTKLRLTNNMRGTVRNDSLQNLTGTVAANYSLSKNLGFSTNLNYLFQPTFSLTTAQSFLRYRRDKFSASFNVNQDLQNKGTTAGLLTAYDFGYFTAALDLDWSRGDGLSASLRTSTSLAPLGENGKYQARSRSNISQSVVHANVFLDKDQDGVFGPDDQAIENAGLRIGRRTTERSNKDGIIREYTNYRNEIVGITLDDSTMENAFYRPLIKGYRTVLRPGVIANVDFPVAETGSIDGFVYFEDGTPVPRVKLQVLDQEGEVVAQTQTLFDGFFSVEYLFPGTYTVRIDPALKRVSVSPQIVTISEEELFVFDLEFILKEQLSKSESQQSAAQPERDGRIAQISAKSADMGGETEKAAPQSDGTDSVQHPAGIAPEAGLVKSAGFMTMPKLAVQYLPPSSVKRIRVGEHQDKTRLVLDLSGAVAYNVYQIDAFTIRLDLPNVSWTATSSWTAKDQDALLESLQASRIEGTSSYRLLIKGRHPLRLAQDGFLPAKRHKGDRIYLDLRASALQ